MKSCALALATLMLLATAVVAEEKGRPDSSKLPAATPRPVDFGQDIQPILARNCIACHGPAKQRGGLRLDDGQAALRGGNSGAVLKPGDAVGSRLLQAVAGLDPDVKMPPEGKKPLSSAEIALLRAWIEQGAKWPRDAGGSAAQGGTTTHWAFLPIKRPAAPRVRGPGWVRQDLDRFILARLEAEGIAPSPEADRATLIRRLSLDLLGLPPSPREVDEFLRDPRPDAYEQLVDRLLSSPHYGERWGRHWLDAARYADSDGYEKDTGRPHAWRWRHWVIEALNRDLPFDQFAIEQLAGDLLPDASTEQKVATGFHRNTLTNREGGVDQEQFRVEAVVDRVNTTARVFLGVTLGCAQCHDHKYDPFSMRDYYQLFAFFNSDSEADIAAPLPGEAETYARKKAEWDRKKADLDAAVAAYRKERLPAAAKQWEATLGPDERKKLPAAVAQALAVQAAQRTPAQNREIAEFYAKSDPQLVKLTRAVAEHQKTAPAPGLAQTLALGARRKTHILMRGDFLRPGAEVQPGTPAVLPPLTPNPSPPRGEGRQRPLTANPASPEGERGAPDTPRPSGERGRGEGATPTRLDLARWLVSPENPLTPRVTVNWVWQKYFGRGLVPTLDDFGTQGEKSSHPELLDWLASEFLHRRWSLKELHRLIVTSATYRQSSATRPELVGRDPLNVLLARQSRLRLEAEIVRDAALTSSGLLAGKIGGPSVRPPQPAGISELTYAGSARWVESTGPDRYRRGLYTWFQRTSPYPMLMTFDAPDSNVCCVRRERSNTPLQALTLLNDTVFVECAQALGRRIVTEVPAHGTSEGAIRDRIRHGFRLCLGREPSSAEMERLAELFADFHAACRARPEAAAKLVGAPFPSGTDSAEAGAWVALARTLLNLDEFVTRE
jgi:hypothetical protein